MPSPEEIAQQRKLLEIHRSSLAHYLNPAMRRVCLHVPPAVMHGIRENARSNPAEQEHPLRGGVRRSKITPTTRSIYRLRNPIPLRLSSQVIVRSTRRINRAKPSQAESLQGGTATVTSQSQKQVDGFALRRLLIANFSDSDLRDLCDDLGIDYESLPDRQRATKPVN